MSARYDRAEIDDVIAHLREWEWGEISLENLLLSGAKSLCEQGARAVIEQFITDIDDDSFFPLAAFDENGKLEVTISFMDRATIQIDLEAAIRTMLLDGLEERAAMAVRLRALADELSK